MSDILTDEQLYEHWSKYGGYQSSCDNVINDVKQEAYFDEEIIELLTIAKWLDAQRAALQARVTVLEAALRDLYDATTPVERQIGVATEDWHHVLFEASGTAHSVLAASHQPDGGEA